jgi:esterase/lipase superfamily enzyme
MSAVRNVVIVGSFLAAFLIGTGPAELRAQTAAPVGEEEPASRPLTPAAEIGAVRQEDGEAAAAAEAPPAAGMADPNAISVFFATNRNPVPRVTRPDAFGNELGNTTLFGRVDLNLQGGSWVIGEISVEGGDVNRALAAPELLAGTAPASASPETLGIEAAGPLASFAAQATAPASDVLAFVHGAGHSFESAVIDAARLAESYQREGRPLIPLVFSYPSNGHSTVTGYFADRRDAGMSGLAMAEGFKRMLAFLAEARERRPLGRQALIAHSLGAYAIRQAVQAIISDPDAPEKVFDVVLIMAGDEDADTLSSDQELRPLLSLTDAVVAYFAGNDFLMRLSTLANLRRPIGRRGPSNLATEDYGDVDVLAVDATAFAAVGDIHAHSYFLRSPKVVADAKAVFAGELPDAIPGRRMVSDRLYRIIDGAPVLAQAAPLHAAGTEAAPIYVFTGGERNVAPPLETGAQPNLAGQIVELTGANARELALHAASQVQSGGEILPGRFDEVMVLAPSIAAPAAVGDSPPRAIVQAPSKAFLDAVLPRGFVSETSPEIASTSAQSGTVRLQLVPGMTVVAEPVRPDLEQTLGLTTWSGRIVATVDPTGALEPATGSVSLVYDEQGVSGTVTVNDKIFEIEPSEAQAVLEGPGATAPARLSEVTDVTTEPVLGDELPREGEEPEDRSEAPAEPEDQRAIRQEPQPVQSAAVPKVDLLIVFTDSAARRVGDIRRAAAEYVERSNLSLDLSQISGRINAVAAEVVTGSESGSGQTDLNLLRSNGDGQFDEVHSRRAALNADGVVLVVADSNVAGFAGSNVGASNAFLIVRSDHAGRHFSLIHEIGHWAGATHGRGASVPTMGWASVMKHMPNPACPPGGARGACRRDGYWTDAPRLHPRHGFQLGTAGASNAPKLRASAGLQKFSAFR